jgi:hypothetical protein
MFGKWHGAHCSTCAFNNEVHLPCSSGVPLPNTCLTLRIAGLVSGDKPPVISYNLRTYTYILGENFLSLLVNPPPRILA